MGPADFSQNQNFMDKTNLLFSLYSYKFNKQEITENNDNEFQMPTSQNEARSSKSYYNFLHGSMFLSMEQSKFRL